MRQAVIYPSTQTHLIIKGGKEKCRSLSTEHIVSIGKRGDKAAILQIFENMCNEEEIASQAIRNIRKRQLEEIRKSMPKDKQGYEIKINGHTFVSFIRRLTPSECAELQTIPHDYEFVSSETQQYHGIGNGWNIETIKHIFQFIPEEIKKDMKVLSLFDGISGGQMALNGIGANVSTYLASEIDKHAIANTMHNFPNTIQLGSVTELNVDEMVQQYGIPDILIGGSPCQGFSMSGKLKGAATSHGEEIYTLDRYLELKAQGFEFEGQSYLFWEYMRVLTELRKYNQNVFFFLENVEMLDKWERCLSHAIGIRGVHINSALVSAQNRKRIYWSNIRVKDLGNTSIFDFSDDPFELPRYQTDIPQPKDRNIFIKDILQQHAGGKYYLKDDTVSSLMEETDISKLKDYLLEPQVSIDEVLEYMNANTEYSSLTDNEKKRIAKLGYELEKQRLHNIYYGNEKELYEE